MAMSITSKDKLPVEAFSKPLCPKHRVELKLGKATFSCSGCKAMGLSGLYYPRKCRKCLKPFLGRTMQQTTCDICRK